MTRFPSPPTKSTTFFGQLLDSDESLVLSLSLSFVISPLSSSFGCRSVRRGEQGMIMHIFGSERRRLVDRRNPMPMLVPCIARIPDV